MAEESALPGDYLGGTYPVGPNALYIRISPDHGHIRVSLHGVADSRTCDQLRSALAAIDVESARAVELDLCELQFCDLDCAREMIDFAGRVGERGGRVGVAEWPNPLVYLMLRTLDAGGHLSFPRGTQTDAEPQPGRASRLLRLLPGQMAEPPRTIGQTEPWPKP